ncbi:AraC family transcriptional regulator [Thalassobaculum fulvum]|uniref:AraC family transcriptional regulator n=1 Tax=Thalassobaculum fulvum TaxID=1633335 RepID=A0A919CSD9_9PROT|nr:AraC family transcriptional regulator [Thalassobaculum fulvum]GHD61993.1 AraC family transcriptional regulator [Thalassobaculum fulvum]
MDVLDDILDTLNLRGAFYYRTDFSPPWAVTVPDLRQAARFHLVVQGSCHVAFPSGASIELGPGDLVLIPRGRSHVIADRSGRDAPPLETVLSAVGYDGEGVLAVGDGDPAATTQLVCGHFTFRTGADHPILRALPEFLVTTNAARAREPWLDDVLRLVVRRVFADGAGSAAAVTRLSEVVFIELLRAGIGTDGTLRAVLDAFRDRQVGRALQLMHAEPARPWTVDGLAAEVGMSRSRFAARFSELMEVGPMAYLADWRLQKALSLLDDPQASVQQVAGQTGYQSPAAFTRAFAARFGLPPTEYRRIASNDAHRPRRDAGHP